MRTSGVKRILEKGQFSFAFCGLINFDHVYHGRGNFGMVADNGDGTVTKLFFRKDNPIDRDHAYTMYKNEIGALKLLSGTALSTIQIPALIDDYGEVDHEQVMAAFRMTKMDGRVLGKQQFHEWDQTAKDKLYHDLGTLIADFHKQATAQIGAETAQDIELTVHECEIAFVSELDTKRSSGIISAMRHYRECQVPTIQHGDLHLGNIMMADDGRLSLIDFGTLGAVSDRLLDIVKIADCCAADTTTPDRHGQILAAYNDRRGTDIDETTLLLSRLATATGRLKNAWYDKQRRREELGNIDEILPRLADAGVIPRVG
jgi:aminoglycoside phosphotransferase